MKLVIVTALIFGLTALSKRDLVAPPYEMSKFAMLPNFIAKEYCSCYFVMNLGEDYCHEYVAVTNLMPSISVKNQTVKTRFLVFWTGRAQYVNENLGCRLE